MWQAAGPVRRAADARAETQRETTPVPGREYGVAHDAGASIATPRQNRAAHCPPTDSESRRQDRGDPAESRVETSSPVMGLRQPRWAGRRLDEPLIHVAPTPVLARLDAPHERKSAFASSRRGTQAPDQLPCTPQSQLHVAGSRSYAMPRHASIFSCTCSRVRIPARTVATQGSEDANRSARWASVVQSGNRA